MASHAAAPEGFSTPSLGSAALPPSGGGTGQQAIRLLDVDPDFAAGVDAPTAARAAAATVVPLQYVPPGPWEPSSLCEPESLFGPFAVVVVDGLLTRDVQLADRIATQLIGAGDVLAIGEPEETIPRTEHTWTAATDVRLAVLDRRFLAAARQWPWLMTALARRLGAWADRGALLQAITQLGRVDMRVLAVLWHLAGRWGRVRTDGVTVPLRLTHEALGHLVGAQRPTVTLALKDLRDRRLVTRLGRDGWLLAERGRTLLESEIDVVRYSVG